MPQCTCTDQQPLLAREKQLPEAQFSCQHNNKSPKRLSIHRVAIMLSALLILTLIRVSLAIGVFDRSSDTHQDRSPTSIEKRVSKILKHTPLIGMYGFFTPPV